MILILVELALVCILWHSPYRIKILPFSLSMSDTQHIFSNFISIPLRNRLSCVLVVAAKLLTLSLGEVHA